MLIGEHKGVAITVYTNHKNHMVYYARIASRLGAVEMESDSRKGIKQKITWTLRRLALE